MKKYKARKIKISLKIKEDKGGAHLLDLERGILPQNVFYSHLYLRYKKFLEHFGSYIHV